MADIDLTGIVLISSPDEAETYSVDFATGHSVGDIVRPSGAIVGGISQNHGGLVIHAGDANGNKTLILRRGLVENVAGAGAAADVRVFSDGDNTASDTEPAGAAGTGVTFLGEMVTATRMIVDPQFYEKGA
jgi:hypothetical protein